MKLPFVPDDRWRDVLCVIAAVTFFVLIGCIFIGFQVESAPPVYVNGAVWNAFLWAFEWLAGGFLIGFIFAIPRARKPDEKINDSGPAYSVNANLEEISDWLTKIVVGLGLVELGQIPEYLRRISRWVARSLSDPTQAAFDQVVSFASCVVLYYAIVGFLAGYLLTRLFVAPALGRAEKSVSSPYAPSATTSNKIREFWQPGGKAANAANEKKLLEWLADNGYKISLAGFAYAPKFEAAREKAIKDLGIS